MKKTCIVLALLLCMVSMNVTAAGQAEGTAATAKPIVMKIGHSFTTETSRHISLLKFKEMVETRSNGRMKVELYPSSQLGSEMEMLEAVKMGTLEGLRCGPFEDAATELLIYTMPFLFSDMDSVHRVTRGEITQKIIKNTEKNGIKVLAVGDSGEFRQFSNNVRPITKPEDMKGLKMRTPPMESIVKIISTLGGNPVSIPFNETYMALKTGVADGQENPYPNIDSMKFYEVQKYLSVVNYQYHAEMMYVPLTWFNSLSADLQKIVVDAAKEHMLLSDTLLIEESTKSRDLLYSKMIVNELTDAQRQVFIDRVQPVYDYYIKKGVFTQNDIDEIRRVASGK